jgi:eukaryotic-like serine/threonine-protein kinase
MPRGTDDRRSPLAGQFLADRYRLDAPIEAGHTGEVWSARDTVLNRPVAVKMINQALSADEASVSRFRAESRFAAALSHSGVARVFDYGEQQSASLPCPYLVMERVAGRPLSELTAQAGPLPAHVVLDITAQAGRALQAAHDIGITHRDIKPANLLITEDGTVKITDFGVAALTPGSQVAVVTDAELVRSAAYISPEAAEGKPVTQASDIYSLGVVAYECATGRLPFAGRTPREQAAAREGEPWPLPDHIPAPVRELIMRMIARDPWLRPGSAGAVADRASTLRKQLFSTAGWRADAAPTGTGWTGPVAAGTGPPAAGTGQAMETRPVPSGTRPVAPEAGTVAQRAGMAAPGAGTAAPRAGTAGQRAGMAAPGAAPMAAGTGTDPASSTAPQRPAGDARPGISQYRRRPTMAVAAAAVGVLALAGAIATMMLGGHGKPPTAASQVNTPAPAAQGMVPAVGPTQRPGKAHAGRRPAKTAAGGSATTQPARGGATPAQSQPVSSPSGPSMSPSRSPAPTKSAPANPSPTAPAPSGSPPSASP